MRQIHVAAMVTVIAGLLGVTTIFASGAESKSPAHFRLVDEPKYLGKTLSYWINVIRDNDENQLSIAFDAIRSMGPEAWPAVPELTRIVAAPFVPIHLGTDSDEAIACKLYDIEIRSEAIDALAAIGESASPATKVVIEWAAVMRVVPEYLLTREASERFIDLVTLDAQYRMRVVGAVKGFGDPALPTLVRMLKSSDVEQRRLAVTALGEEALSIAGDLLQSDRCEDKHLAITILNDLGHYVARAYLFQVKQMIVCDAN